MRAMLIGLFAAVMLTIGIIPSAQADPLEGGACSDPGKLAYDPNVGQIACDGSSWVSSVEPVGIRPIGAPCTAGESNNIMASSPDGYLIWCPSSNGGTWTVYQQ